MTKMFAFILGRLQNSIGHTTFFLLPAFRGSKSALCTLHPDTATSACVRKTLDLKKVIEITISFIGEVTSKTRASCFIGFPNAQKQLNHSASSNVFLHLEIQSSNRTHFDILLLRFSFEYATKKFRDKVSTFEFPCCPGQLISFYNVLIMQPSYLICSLLLLVEIFSHVQHFIRESNHSSFSFCGHYN